MSKNIIKLNNHVVVTAKRKGYTYKGKYPFWKGIQVGDVIEISFFLKGLSGASGGGVYSPNIHLISLRSGIGFSGGINEVLKYLHNVTIEEL